MPAAAYIALALSTLILASVVGAVALAVRTRLMPGPKLVGRTVVVNTRAPDDQSIRGVLVGQYADRYVLREAVFLVGTGTIDAVGLIHVPILGVSTIQEILPPVEPAEVPVPVLSH